MILISIKILPSILQIEYILHAMQMFVNMSSQNMTFHKTTCNCNLIHLKKFQKLALDHNFRKLY